MTTRLQTLSPVCHFKGGPFDGTTKRREDLYGGRDQVGAYIGVNLPLVPRLPASFDLHAPISPDGPAPETIDYRYRLWSDGYWRGLTPIPLAEGSRLFRFTDESEWVVMERIDYDSEQAWLRCTFHSVRQVELTDLKRGDDLLATIDHLAEFGLIRTL